MLFMFGFEGVVQIRHASSSTGKSVGGDGLLQSLRLNVHINPRP